ncbi:LLM class flavin-dependent oxidoreductase [Mycobacterium sp. URHB0044]|uniref:LLM class flavin-dependent oxidoreductase n=1 Tax=Mycobacterium sp. URHB0044 TaxID=1380386 RepID=UPI00068630AD|nr:LLM class flavin-dependent oxidoreductase [Mycobacterium sp. URHB0044]
MTLGFKIDGRPGEDIAGLAKKVERAGFAELWVCEDLGLAGGMSQVVAALASTDRLHVGLGIAPAAARNVAYLAMEFATVMRMFPSRFRPGIGHGVPSWLEQVGAHPDSLMTCLAEVAAVLPRLISGESVTFSGDHVHLDAVQLTQPPSETPVVSLGVRGPKGIALAPKVGAGLILAEGSVPEYVAAVRKTVGSGTRITVFVWANMTDADQLESDSKFHDIVRAKLVKPALAHQLGGADGAAIAVSDVAITGSEDDCRRAVERLFSHGADAVILQPLASTEETQIERFAALAKEFSSAAVGRLG